MEREEKREAENRETSQECSEAPKENFYHSWDNQSQLRQDTLSAQLLGWGCCPFLGNKIGFKSLENEFL